jgi:hypothetical protein
MTTWVVVLEIDAGRNAPVLDIDEIDRLVQAAAREGVVIRYDSARRTLEFGVEAEAPQDALTDAMAVWRVAARKSGAPRWPITSVVVTRSDPDDDGR